MASQVLPCVSVQKNIKWIDEKVWGGNQNIYKIKISTKYYMVDGIHIVCGVDFINIKGHKQQNTRIVQ